MLLVRSLGRLFGGLFLEVGALGPYDLEVAQGDAVGVTLALCLCLQLLDDLVELDQLLVVVHGTSFCCMVRHMVVLF